MQSRHVHRFDSRDRINTQSENEEMIVAVNAMYAIA